MEKMKQGLKFDSYCNKYQKDTIKFCEKTINVPSYKSNFCQKTLDTVKINYIIKKDSRVFDE